MSPQDRDALVALVAEIRRRYGPSCVGIINGCRPDAPITRRCIGCVIAKLEAALTASSSSGPSYAQVDGLKAMNTASPSGYYACGWQDAIDAVLALFAQEQKK